MFKQRLNFWLFILLTTVSVLTFCLRFISTGHAMYGDGNGYFLYAYSLFFQGNLDFRPIVEHLSNFQGTHYTFNRIFWDTTPTPTGYLPNVWMVGTALFWLPAMALFRLAVQILGISVNNFDPVWEFVAGVGAIGWGILGLSLLSLIIAKKFGQRQALLVTVILAFASPFTYYLMLEPTQTHSIIFFLVTLILWITTCKDPSNLNWFLVLGLLTGLSSIVRPSGILTILLSSSWLLSRHNFKIWLLFLLGFLVGVTPQLLVQQTLYGNFWYQPYLFGDHGGTAIDATMLFKSLFSAERGLFVWHPVLLLSFAGFSNAVKSTQKWSLAIYLLAVYLVIGTWHVALSPGFGNRFYIEVLPIFALGLASFLHNKSRRFVVGLTTVAIVWNILILTQFFLYSSRLVDAQGINLVNLYTGQFFAPIEMFQLLSGEGWWKGVLSLVGS